LIAASGLLAVAYDTNNKDDLENIIKHIQQNGADLGIDNNRLGFFSMSSSGGLASNVAFREERKYLKFAVFYYAFIMTPDNFEREVEDAACKQVGCLGAELSDVKQLRTDLPLLVVRLGRDNGLAQLDHFTEFAKEAGVPLTLLRFDQGIHGFDYFNKTPPGENRDKAIEIIKQTLEFMKEHAYDQ
jgi:acetyl esterase/lipase